MKKRGILFLLILLLCMLCRTPNYWKLFEQDMNKYKTDTFYYVIKEEYREDVSGKRLYHPKFTDIQDGDIILIAETLISKAEGNIKKRLQLSTN